MGGERSGRLAELLLGKKWNKQVKKKVWLPRCINVKDSKERTISREKEKEKKRKIRKMLVCSFHCSVSVGSGSRGYGGFVSARRESQRGPGQALPCCGAFLLGWAETFLRSQLTSKRGLHSAWGGHGVCRHWRSVLLALAKLDTKGSSPLQFLGFSLQKGGRGRERTKTNFSIDGHQRGKGLHESWAT